MILFFPLFINAHSNYLYVGGESIGIELKGDYILVVGTYKINGVNPELMIGDKIIGVNETKVSNIKELTKSVQGKKEVTIKFIRDDKILKEKLKINYENGIYKTGLYVKDSIVGIGTLTYIDPNTDIFGCLGHEINEKITKKLFESKEGTIFSSTVSKVVKSKNGVPGEKISKFNSNNIYGNIQKNTKTGIYGLYIGDTSKKELYEVAKIDEIKIGKAKMLTTIKDNNVEEFEINITRKFKNNNHHDILFEITDQNLLSKTNGIVQGMSGSPIIQNGKIIGAVTHVIVDNPTKGYGISIEHMLEEGEN